MLIYVEKELFRAFDAIDAYLEGHGSEEGLLKDLKGIAKRISPVWREYNEKVIVPQGRDPIVFNEDALTGEGDEYLSQTYFIFDYERKNASPVDMASEKDVRSFFTEKALEDLSSIALRLTKARIAEMKEQPVKRESYIMKAIGALAFFVHDLRNFIKALKEAKK